MDKDHLNIRINELLEQVGLEHRSNDRVGTFSHGMKQRLFIARALILNNGKIVFDKLRHNAGSIDDFKNTCESFVHE